MIIYIFNDNNLEETKVFSSLKKAESFAQRKTSVKCKWKAVLLNDNVVDYWVDESSSRDVKIYRRQVN